MKNLVKTNGNYFPAIPSLLDEFLNRDWLDSSVATWRSNGSTLPAVNVLETNDNLTIQVAAPGMKRDNFKVELDNHVLTISSQHEENWEENDQERIYNRREFSYQAFQRSFTLPEGKVKGEEIAATYKDGILHIIIPKTETAKRKPTKQIAIG